MSEPATPAYIVRDYCATCGERLVQLEHGGRVARWEAWVAGVQRPATSTAPT